MEELKWVDSSDGEIPENAVEGGNEGDTVLYVGRMSSFGDLIPGKVIAGQGCYIAYGCEEHHFTSDYQILVNDAGVTLEWVPASDGEIPENSVPGGETASGETLYIGRGTHEDAVICGKIHQTHNCLYVAHCEGEHAINEYEVLTCKADE